jgi:hypothetical protein
MTTRSSVCYVALGHRLVTPAGTGTLHSRAVGDALSDWVDVMAAVKEGLKKS